MFNETVVSFDRKRNETHKTMICLHRQKLISEKNLLRSNNFDEHFQTIVLL